MEIHVAGVDHSLTDRTRCHNVDMSGKLIRSAGFFLERVGKGADLIGISYKLLPPLGQRDGVIDPLK